MGSLSAAGSLLLPVRLRGIQLGRPIDILLDLDHRNVHGFVVLCGDESRRFLPLAASQVLDDAIAVGSALMLLEDVAFYEDRGASFRSLLGTKAGGGIVRDAWFTSGGAVAELEVEVEGGRLRIPVPTRQAA
jgi:hypothetical protein